MRRAVYATILSSSLKYYESLVITHKFARDTFAALRMTPKNFVILSAAKDLSRAFVQQTGLTQPGAFMGNHQ